MENELNAYNSDNILLQLGKRIKAMRLERKWTQEQFDEAAQINDKEVSHIEAGKRNITIGTLVKISSVFDVAQYLLLN